MKWLGKLMTALNKSHMPVLINPVFVAHISEALAVVPVSELSRAGGEEEH